MSLISKHSVLFEFPKESDWQMLELFCCGYIKDILNNVIKIY